MLGACIDSVTTGPRTAAGSGAAAAATHLSPSCTCADGRAAYDYTSWAGTRQLTATLLRHDFNIDWWLPEGQLVPTVTNRANYIHWINDLLQLSSPEGGWGRGSAGK